ncbi:unnamed protein product, partial [Rotaria magnacalcarata]
MRKKDNGESKEEEDDDGESKEEEDDDDESKEEEEDDDDESEPKEKEAIWHAHMISGGTLNIISVEELFDLRMRIVDHLGNKWTTDTAWETFLG